MKISHGHLTSKFFINNSDSMQIIADDKLGYNTVLVEVFHVKGVVFLLILFINIILICTISFFFFVLVHSFAVQNLLPRILFR